MCTWKGQDETHLKIIGKIKEGGQSGVRMIRKSNTGEGMNMIKAYYM
jgi:hypothetical protein